MAITTAAAIIIGVVASSITTLITADQQSGSQASAQEENIAYAREEQARLEKQRDEEAAKEEARLAPWYEAQKSALERYTQMAENPEISDYTRLRLEEEEKAINKELAAKGLLFSGPAAELRQKARERIIAQETESAKGMLANVMNAQAPASGIYPGTAQYDAMIASLNPKATANTAAGQGALGVGASVLGGVQSYMTYKGSQDATEAYKQRTQGLYNYPLSLYGQGYGGGQGVGLMASPEGLPIY